LKLNFAEILVTLNCYFTNIQETLTSEIVNWSSKEKSEDNR